ncbi:integrase [Helicobacter suis]|uniref:integrase n=1 Tax=Helicobacter suis TaxID=104628 RepID=UPI000CF1B8F5|nr:integrase [Helicobacter suis]
MPYTRKIIKPNLNSKDLKQLQNANIQYSKKTKEHYFKYTQDIDYKLFNIALLCDEHGTSFYGSFGAKQLFFLIAKIALQAKSNKIALDRHYAHYALQIVPRTLNLNLNILQDKGFIKLIKGKHRYTYIYLNDYRQIKGYTDTGINKRANIPTPFFLAILAYAKKIVQALKEVAFKIKGRHGLFTLKSPKDRGRMRRFNDVILEFSPLDDPNTTIYITYEQLTGKQIPNMKCFYQLAIVKKNLIEALKSQMVLGEAA